MDLITAQPRMAGLLGENEDKLLRQWSEQVLASGPAHSDAGETRRDLGDLLELIIKAMEGADESASGQLRAALGEWSRSMARRGATPSECAVSIFALKDAVYQLAGGLPDLLQEYLVFSRMMDDLGLVTFETYAAAREQIIADQAEAVLELSTPVVRLWDGIIAVPLVGTLDSARTQMVMERLLDALVAAEAEHAVIDITGVPTVDTEVAQHLLKTVHAARLLGAECTICGIRPQIAHTIVSLGIEFADIVTKATLADALAYALTRSGLKVGPA